MVPITPSQVFRFFSGVFLLLAGVTAFTPSYLIPSADAAQGVACVNNGDFGTMTAVEEPSQTYSDDSRGTRSDVWIVDSAECQRISSVYIQAPGGGGFEFGYLVGYSTCAGYTGHFYSQPTLFFTSFTTTGSKQCRVWESRHPASGQYDTFRVSDINANTYWGSYYEGEELQPNGVNLDFSKGYNVIGVERGAAADGGYARFNNLDEYHDGNDWSDFDNVAAAGGDHDPNYHWDFLAADVARTQAD